MIVLFTLLTTVTVLASAMTEDIAFEDLAKAHAQRNVGSTTREDLILKLKRQNKDDVELHLRENKALSVNVPVYETVYENGKHRAVRKQQDTIKGVKFYRDLDRKAAFQIRCEPRPDGNCIREFEGVVEIDGDMYDVYPKHRRVTSRYTGNTNNVPHILEKSEVNNLHYDDITTKFDGQKMLKRKIELFKQKRQEPKVYTVESIIAIDPPLWDHLVKRTANKFGTTNDTVVENDARRYYTTLIHLVSMAYEGINHPDFTIKIVISGFLFQKEKSEKMLEVGVYNEDGTHREGVHFGDFLSSVYKEMRENGNLPNADHVYTFTLTSAQGVSGANCLGCICETRSWGWSISAASSLSYEARVTAHEFGHGLGLYHIDVNRYSDIRCDPSDGYVMGPDVKGRFWTFSNCSIRELQVYLAETGHTCLLDSVDVFKTDEWNEYTSKMPGEIRNITEQCIDINNGKSFFNQEQQSVLCNAVTDMGFCYDMKCVGESGCPSLAAADGTPCGLPSANKWCFAGQCVSRTGANSKCEKEIWEYQKTLTETRSGIPCQRWDSQSPHEHKFKSDNYFPGETVADAGNFCRNPDGEPSAWCYTTDSSKRWDYCDIKQCIDVMPETTGDDENCFKTWSETYLGTKSVAKSGYPCQRWDSNSPHSHSHNVVLKFLDATVADAANYCRDPTARGTPWCMLDYRWDFCDVPECSTERESTCAEENWQYQKTLNKTRGSIPCQRWDSQLPHEHRFKVDSYFPGETVADAGNFCRNPDNEPSAWCYTTDSSKRWDYCDTKLCKDDTCYSKHVEYTGTVSETKGGIPCQNWDSNTPNSNWYKGQAEGNACRLLGEKTPWCYLGRSWDFCEISKCP